MNLEYNILWIEDTPISIRRDKRQISDYIKELGFECVVEDIGSFSDFESKIGYKKTANYDLLLVDLDLGKRPSKDEGESIIRKIRDEGALILGKTKTSEFSVHSPSDTTNPHNMYILVLVQLGIVGLLSMLSIMYYQIKLSFKESNRFFRDAGFALPFLFLVIMWSDSYLLGHFTTLLFVFFSSFLYKDFEDSS